MTIKQLTRNTNREIVYRSLTNEFLNLDQINERLNQPVANLDSVLYQLSKLSILLCERINGKLSYARNPNTTVEIRGPNGLEVIENKIFPNKEKKKSRSGGRNTMVSIDNARKIDEFLERSDIFSTLDMNEAIEFSSSSLLHHHLKRLEAEGRVVLVSNTRPKVYKVVNAKQQKQNELPLNTLHSKTLIPEVSSFPGINLTESIQNIVKLDQQNKMYRQVLHQIAQLLENVDFLESE